MEVKLHVLVILFELMMDELKFPFPYRVQVFVVNDGGNPFYCLVLYPYLFFLYSPLSQHCYVDEPTPFLNCHAIQVTMNVGPTKLIDVSLLLFHHH